MKVLLLKDVKSVGKVGEVVNVSEGYARNMLIPSKSAVVADNNVLKQVKQKEDLAKAKDNKARQEAKVISDRISSEKLVIKAKVGSNGKLFGAITNTEIAEQLNKKYKIDFDKRKITIKDTIKNIGNYSVDVKLYNGVSAAIDVEVVAE